MKNRLCLLIVACLTLSGTLWGAERPNVVFIVSEDNSTHYLRHFFPGGAKTPAIEALARDGLTYDHAFSNAPVCSVARTTLATSCYGPRIGTQYHRRYAAAPLPDGVKLFHEHLRAVGYFATNRSKTDYAVAVKQTWHESSGKAHWRNRPDKKQPFFHMESHAVCHEGSLHFSQKAYETEKTQHDPKTVPLPAYFPDTPLFRYTHARYLDRMLLVDQIVADRVAQLEADGLLEDTFIFYFGDHGGVLPRGKGYAYDNGLHVPLIVRVPENFKHLVDAPRGSRMKGFVEFVDFGPTVLALAGLPAPQDVDGKAFLGKGVKASETEKRQEAFGYADRFDEKYDFIRTLRQGRFHYMRCYQPYLPDGLQNNYRYKMLAYEEWRQLWKAGKLNDTQAAFYRAKPVELLFDCEADPHNVKNLAADPKYAAQLKRMRARLQERMKAMPDLSLAPESMMVREAMANPVAWGAANKARLNAALDTADLSLRPFKDARAALVEALGSGDAMQRLWALTACTGLGETARPLVPAARNLLADTEPLVQLRAIEFLGALGELEPQAALIPRVNDTPDPIFATEALNSVVWFRDFLGKPVERAAFTRSMQGGDVDDRLNYINGVPYPPKKWKKKK